MTVVSRCVASLGRSTRLAGSQRVQSRGLASLKPPASLFSPLDTFHERHIGPDDAEAAKMLRRLGYMKMNTFIGDTVPPNVTVPSHDIDMPALSESQLHERVTELAAMNKPFKSYIGMGYHNAVVPPVILRNVYPVAHVA
jgi:glycine dehydrogenase